MCGNMLHDSESLKCDEAEVCAFSLSDLSLSVPLEDLKTEQHADHSLSGLFKLVVSTEEVKNSFWGYFMLNGILVRK